MKQADGNERFLSRWSRLKRTGAEPAEGMDTAAPATTPQAPGAPPSANGQLPATAAAPTARLPDTTADREVDAVVAALPPVESLTIESDFAQFFQPKVPDALRRAAVKKLFADPHFNIMDGLDTYIDDYSKPDPIPPEMLREIRHARGLLGFDEEDAKKAKEAMDALAAETGNQPDHAAASATEAEGEAATDDAAASTMEPGTQLPAPDPVESAPAPVAASPECAAANQPPDETLASDRIPHPT